MNLVGSGCWKTFNFKSMKNSKSSSVKPTINEDTTIPIIKKEPKKGSKDNPKQSAEQPKYLLKTLKLNKNNSFRESAKGVGEGGVSKVIIHCGNQIGGSNKIEFSQSPKATKANRDCFTMVTDLRRAASFPLMINTSNNLNHNRSVKKLDVSVPTTTRNNQIIINNNSESMFQFFDSNGSGYISEDELIQMMNSLGEPISRTEAKSMIKEADVNHDGKIDYLEFRNLLNRLPLIFSSPSSMSLREAFNIFDQDSDGFVNLEEVKLIATAIGIKINENNIDIINNRLQQSTLSASSSTSKHRLNSNSNSEKITFYQLKNFFDLITKK